MATRVYGNIHRLNQVAGALPRLSNAMLNSALGKWGAGLLGIPTERPLPKYAAQRFSARRYPQHEAPDGVLIVDTFTEWNHPQVGQAALALAERAGPAPECRALAGSGLLRPSGHQQGFAGQRQADGASQCAGSKWGGDAGAAGIPGAELHERLH